MTSTTQYAPPKVLIVGGGPSGLILALSLLQNGVPVRIIEKNAQPRLGQRGAAIMPRSLELFTYLKIIDSVMKRAILTPPVRMYKMPEGVDVLHEFDMAPHREATPSHPFLNPVMLGQDHLEKIFHAALMEYGCSVELGTELVSFEQADGSVRVKLIKKGFSDDEETWIPEESVYEWMVGADGARGVVRKQLGLSFLGESRSVENFIVGDIYVKGISAKHWHIWGEAPDVIISLRATETPGLFNFFIGGKNVNHKKLTTDYASLRECMAAHTGRQKAIKFGEIAWISHFTPNIRMVQKMGHDRVFVAGDAGHVHSPTGGQGMNTGVQDAFNLGWKLALVAKGLAHPSFLESYSEERIPVIAEMISETTKLLDRTLENNRTAWKKNDGLYQLGINYRWSSVVVDEREEAQGDNEALEDEYFKDYDFGDPEDDETMVKLSYGREGDGRLRAGDRAPDASSLLCRNSSPLLRKQACQLFQIFGSGYHTVLVFEDWANTREILHAATLYPKAILRSVVVVRSKAAIPPEAKAADIIVEDKDGHGHDAYCQSSDYGVYVVRPDGMLGAIVKGPAGMHRYFQGILKGKNQ